MTGDAVFVSIIANYPFSGASIYWFISVKDQLSWCQKEKAALVSRIALCQSSMILREKKKNVRKIFSAVR